MVQYIDEDKSWLETLFLNIKEYELDGTNILIESAKKALRQNPSLTLPRFNDFVETRVRRIGRGEDEKIYLMPKFSPFNIVDLGIIHAAQLYPLPAFQVIGRYNGKEFTFVVPEVRADLTKQGMRLTKLAMISVGPLYPADREGERFFTQEQYQQFLRNGIAHARDDAPVYESLLDVQKIDEITPRGDIKLSVRNPLDKTKTLELVSSISEYPHSLEGLDEIRKASKVFTKFYFYGQPERA